MRFNRKQHQLGIGTTVCQKPALKPVCTLKFGFRAAQGKTPPKTSHPFSDLTKQLGDQSGENHARQPPVVAIDGQGVLPPRQWPCGAGTFQTHHHGDSWRWLRRHITGLAHQPKGRRVGDAAATVIPCCRKVRQAVDDMEI